MHEITEKTLGTDGRKQDVPLCGPTHQQKDVLVTEHNCAPQNRCNGKPRQHNDVEGSVNSCSLLICRCNSKPFSHIGTDLSSNWLCISLDTLQQCISRNTVQCAPTTDVMSHERRLCERPVKTT